MDKRDATAKPFVVGFSFGHRGSEPGLSNDALAKAILASNPACIAVQWEIGLALRRLGRVPDFEAKKHRREGRYLDTRECALQFADFFRNSLIFGATRGARIAVAAHPHHLPRAMRCMRLSLGEAAHLEALPCGDIPYDQESHQRWTRSKKLFFFREMLALPLYWLRNEAVLPWRATD